MAPIELISRIEKSIPGAVLERTVFGRTGRTCAWIESRHLREVAELVAAEGLDQLEDLSVMHMDGSLVLTYFLASSSLPETLVLRCSKKIAVNIKEVDFDSVADIWRMAEPLEIESQDLFGAHYLNRAGEPAWPGRHRLAEGWVGFPLRKDYVFPTEFLGVRHEKRGGLDV